MSPKSNIRRALALVCFFCSVATALFTVDALIVVARNGGLGDGEALFVFPALVIILAIFGVAGAFLWPGNRRALAVVCLSCSAATALFIFYMSIVVARNGDHRDAVALILFPGLVIILAIFGVAGAFLWPRKGKRTDPNVFN